MFVCVCVCVRIKKGFKNDGTNDFRDKFIFDRTMQSLQKKNVHICFGYFTYTTHIKWYLQYCVFSITAYS